MSVKIEKHRNIMSRKFCPYPFDRAHLSSNGDVFICCSAWLHRPIGNIFKESFKDIWNSQTAREIRGSILDESFRFCQADKCPRIISGKIEEEVTEELFLSIIKEKKTVLENWPRLMSLNYDRTCNLYCESCRNQPYVINKEKKIQLIEFQKSLLKSDYFKQVKQITVTGSGEALASPVYMDLFTRINKEEYPDLEVLFRTNGLLFTPGNWEKLKNIHYAIKQISISIDAAKAKTYNKLRRGGNFKQLLDNLAFLKDLKPTHSFQLVLNFVVQKANYREMPGFVKLGKKYDCDAIIFGQLFNFGSYTPEQYLQLAVHKSDHPKFNSLKRILRKSIFKDPIVSLNALPGF